ncbi:hypothetical protein K504DRAFT_452419 [Pleomassaria siparia CBS 279.74]|uniref:Uncharacterized protein n=1 Tax=Pleomassaria siparia CBS 279.74 TaxID=1314801 RepID=A0A6G1KI84_9PLEO|nr:hypothetical protein K504DRAFT_452419 [Pleomassaria siparia CBS 279.74]
MGDRDSFRPRRPSPPPLSGRSREPPSPGLVARSLPSTATLNALPMLSRAPSTINIESTITEMSPSSQEHVQEQWILLPTDKFAIHDPLLIERALDLGSEPLFRELGIKQVSDQYQHDCTEIPDRDSVLTCRPLTEVEGQPYLRGLAYRVQNCEDEKKLLDFYTRQYRVGFKIRKCTLFWIEEYLKLEGPIKELDGKAIVASWPLEKITGELTAAGDVNKPH